MKPEMLYRVAFTSYDMTVNGERVRCIVDTAVPDQNGMLPTTARRARP